MENQINDGGPAFPSASPEMDGQIGMSLRDYFAAHAPRTPKFSFQVRMPTPRPEPVFMDAKGNECPAARSANGHAANDAEIMAWDHQRGRQVLIQWPWAWADAMLAARDAAPADPLRDVTARLHKLSGRYCHVRREWNYHTVSSAPECTFGIYIGSPGGGFAESGPDLPALVARAEAWIAQQNSGTTEPDPDAHAAQQELDIAAQLDGEQEDRERRDALKARTDGLPGCCLHCGTVVNAMGRAADGRPHPGPACLENKGGAPC